MIGTMAAVGIGIGGLALGLIVGLVVHMILKRKGVDVSEEIEGSIGNVVAQLIGKKEQLENALEYYKKQVEKSTGLMEKAYQTIVDTAEAELKKVMDEIKEKVPFHGEEGYGGGSETPN